MNRPGPKIDPCATSPPPLRPTIVEPSLQDWTACRDIARDHGKTFYFACQLLPPARRRAVHAIYAWCRTADDVADDDGHVDRASAHGRLDACLESIEHPRDPVSRAFSWVLQHWNIPKHPALDLINGIRMDLDHDGFDTWEDLRHYSYCVAGTVGLMTAPVLGCCNDTALPYAVDLGIAMQLTNILRDVAEDARIGRLYLPREDLHRFGVSPESILALQPDGDFAQVMRFEIDRARNLYEQARPGISALSLPGQLATLSGSHLYSKILERIEDRGYDVFDGRATVSISAKIRELPIVMASLVRLQTSRTRL